MENGPFEDLIPIENGDIPASYVSLPEGRSWFSIYKGCLKSELKKQDLLEGFLDQVTICINSYTVADESLEVPTLVNVL